MGIGKAIGGLILLLIGVGLFANGHLYTVDILQTFWLSNFITVLTGAIPILLILIGLFVVWLEVDEMKSQKEFEKEEKKSKK